MGRILCIDFGEKRIGLALSDETRTIASGLESLPMKAWSETCATIARLGVEHGVDHIIMGDPISMSGKPSSRSNEVARFKQELERAVRMPVEMVDERFTTVLAQRYLSETHKRVRPKEQPVDIVAATILLEDYLERTKSGEASSADEQKTP